MQLKRLLLLTLIAPLAGGNAVLAQVTDSPEDVSASEAGEMPAETAGNEAITILDQTVPVAEDGPSLLDSEEVGPSAGQADDEQLLSEEMQLAELKAAFAAFNDLRDRGILDEAENVAKQVIEMAIRLFGPTSNDTARALSNLGLIQHLTGNYEAAQQNFESAIEIIEDNEDRLNAELINPLKGLGAAQLADGRPDLAADSYQRAVHISHVNEGPHNLDQVDALHALAEANLRMGDVEAAKNNQDMIYSINLRYYSDDAMSMVPSLMRRAEWQRRTGYYLDERATYRRIIRIIESTKGKDDLQLVEPLMNLGGSYFFVDVTDSQPQFPAASIESGELYFKRAVRIAEENPASTWETEVKAKLALGDYYNFRGDSGRSRRSYREVWNILSGDDEEKLSVRRQRLERPVLLRQNPLPRYVGSARSSSRAAGDPDLREGRVVMAFDVNSRGRVSGLKTVEATPEEFEEVHRGVQRELRMRIYRPRFEDAEATESNEQVFAHTFYYLQPDLAELRAEAALEER